MHGSSHRNALSVRASLGLPAGETQGQARVLTGGGRGERIVADMPRRARVVAVGVPHHVTQRGNNRQQVFFSDAHRRLYLALLAEQAERYRLQILGYCLMPNHVHAIVVPEMQTSMAQGLGRAHNAYSRYFNQSRRRSGHLWQNRFYSAPLDRAHLSEALRYVDLNPVRARLTDEPLEYRWSSAQAHAAGCDAAGLIDPRAWQANCPRGDWSDCGSQQEPVARWEIRRLFDASSVKPVSASSQASPEGSRRPRPPELLHLSRSVPRAQGVGPSISGPRVSPVADFCHVPSGLVGVPGFAGQAWRTAEDQGRRSC